MTQINKKMPVDKMFVAMICLGVLSLALIITGREMEGLALTIPISWFAMAMGVKDDTKQ